MNIRTAISTLILLSLPYIVSAQTVPEKISTASISGRVTVGDKPLPNVLLVLNDQTSTIPRSVIGTKTDEDGNYKFSNVKAGRYSIIPKAIAHVMSNVHQYAQAISIIIGAGEIIENQDFQLKPGGVITGKIVDAEERPVISQKIILKIITANSKETVPYQAPNLYQHNTTDDRGIYRIFGLPPGKYYVAIGEDPKLGTSYSGASEKIYPLTYYPGALTEDKAETIEISEGTEAKNIDITVGKPGKFFQAKGRIFDAASGQPMVGVQLYYGAVVREGTREDVGNWTSRSERTNNKGEFSISGLAPSTYAISMMQEEGFEYFADTVKFDITEKDVDKIEIKAHSGASIRGIVVMDGEKNPAALTQFKSLRINYSVENNSIRLGNRAPQINPDGTFHLRGLRPRKATLNITVYNAYRDFVLLRCEKDGVVLPRSFEVADKAQITGLRLTVGYAAGKISGQVNFTGGTLPPRISVNVQARPLNPEQLKNFGAGGAPISANGRFVIDHLLPGEYEVVVVPPYIPNQQTRYKPVKQQVTVTNNAEATVTLNFDLSEEGGR